MEANEIIRIKPMKLMNQKMVKDGELRLEFCGPYLRYVGDFYAEEPKDKNDHDLGWDMIYNFFNIIIDKRFIAGFEKSWSQFHEHWSICIFVNGFAEDVRIFFRTQKEADEVEERLINYLYGTY